MSVHITLRISSTTMWEPHRFFDPKAALGALRDLRTPFNTPGKSRVSAATALRASIIIASHYRSDQITSKLPFLPLIVG